MIARQLQNVYVIKLRLEFLSEMTSSARRQPECNLRSYVLKYRIPQLVGQLLHVLHGQYEIKVIFPGLCHNVEFLDLTARH